MTLKFTQLRTHFTADDAYLVISFLGEITDALWAIYGPEIIEQQTQLNQNPDTQDDLSEFEWDACEID